MNQWIHESMNQWINEPMNKGVDEWMDGWESYFALSSYIFSGRPLGWGASSFTATSPSSHLSGLLSCLPASSFVAFAAQFFSLCSCYTMRLATSSCNPACRHSRFSARNCANAFCHGRGCKPYRHTKSTNVCAAMGTRPHKSVAAPIPSSLLPVLREIKLLLHYRAHFAGLIFQKCSGVISF